MAYLLGTDTERLAFTEQGLAAEPAGAAHAVDPDSPPNHAGGVLAYALCGMAVRVWPECEFDPDTAEVHEPCAALTRA